MAAKKRPRDLKLTPNVVVVHLRHKAGGGAPVGNGCEFYQDFEVIPEEALAILEKHNPLINLAPAMPDCDVENDETRYVHYKKLVVQFWRGPQMIDVLKLRDVKDPFFFLRTALEKDIESFDEDPQFFVSTLYTYPKPFRVPPCLRKKPKLTCCEDAQRRLSVEPQWRQNAALEWEWRGWCCKHCGEVTM